MRNFFFKLETKFELLTGCLETSACNETVVEANSTFVDYYRETCVYDPTADGTGGQDGASTNLGDQVANAPSGSSGLDKLQMIIGLASGFAALIAGLIGFFVWLHRRVILLLRLLLGSIDNLAIDRRLFTFRGRFGSTSTVREEEGITERSILLLRSYCKAKKTKPARPKFLNAP
jgi:hypothetical protein